MKKRGYFFTLDAFVATGVIIVGIVLLFSVRSTPVEETQSEYFSRDLIQLLSSTRIYEINNPLVDYLEDNGTINNSEYTILEEVGELYYLSQQDMASYVLGNITLGVVPDNYGFEVLIDDTQVYIKNVKGKDYYVDSTGYKVIISSKRLISGELNKQEMWGPLKSEVRVWR